MSLEVEFEERWSGSMNVTIQGRLDSGSVSQLTASLKEKVTVTTEYLILDLAKLSYMNSVAIKLILLYRKKMESRGGKMVAAGTSSQNKTAIEIVHLLPKENLFDTLKEANEHIDKIREDQSTAVARCLDQADEFGQFLP